MKFSCTLSNWVIIQSFYITKNISYKHSNVIIKMMVMKAMNGLWNMFQEILYFDNRTHYTISQSTVWYDTQLTNDSLTTLIVFHCRNYSDSFFSYVHLFQISRATSMLVYMCWISFWSNRPCICTFNKHGGPDFLSLKFRTII